jgi:galactonate dehydratase
VRVSKVEVFKHWVQWRNWVLVRVSTDEGLYGWGEASIPGSVESVDAAIQSIASSYLIGRDPAGIEAHWHGMHHAWRWKGGPILLTAISALEGALWDIEGKRLGVPVYRLLGGPIRDRIHVYASHWIHHAQTLDDVAAEAREAVRRGFTAFKWSPFPRHAYRGDEARVIAEGRERMAAAREAVGPNVDIMIECGEGFTPRAALLAARAVEEYKPFWIEEPIPRENPRALAELKRQFPLPIATGENLLTRWEFREVLESSAADVIQPDLVHAGGVTEVRKIAALADTYYVPVAPHNSGGPIATLMSLHLVASIPNFLILEQMEEERELRAAASTDPLVFEDGYLKLPTGPGWGTDLNLEALADYPSKVHPASGRQVPPHYA